MRTLAFAAAVAFALLSLTAARAATPDTLLPVAIAADEPATEETADASDGSPQARPVPGGCRGRRC